MLVISKSNNFLGVTHPSLLSAHEKRCRKPLTRLIALEILSAPTVSISCASRRSRISRKVSPVFRFYIPRFPPVLLLGRPDSTQAGYQFLDADDRALLNAESYCNLMALSPQAFSTSLKNLIHKRCRETLGPRPLSNRNPAVFKNRTYALDRMYVLRYI